MTVRLFCFSLLIWVATNGCLFAQSKELTREERIFNFHIKDQFIDEILVIYETKPENMMVTIVKKALKKYRSNNYKAAFIEKLRSSFSNDEMDAIERYYEKRWAAYSDLAKTSIKKKFDNFNADLGSLIMEVKDDDEKVSPIEGLMNFKEKVKKARHRSCCANMTVLSGALEIYNLDHQEPLKAINHEAYQEGGILIKAGVLRNPINPPEEGCEYYLFKESTASEPADVRCKVHGKRKVIKMDEDE